MSEIHSNVYLSHPRVVVAKKASSLFEATTPNEFVKLAMTLNAITGEALAGSFLTDLPNLDCTRAESIKKLSKIYVCHFVHSSDGDNIIGRIVSFLHDLVPDIVVQAWGCGDDDPWEFWFKYVNGVLIRQDDTPLEDEEANDHIQETIYKWWHQGLPRTVKEGLLNEAGDASALARFHVVFAGTMAYGSIESIQALAGKSGMHVHNIISKRTNLLVFGQDPGESTIETAESFNIRIISEREFMELISANSDSP